MAPSSGIAIFVCAVWAALSAAPAGAATLLAQTSAAEIEFWRSVERSKDPAEFEAYLQVGSPGTELEFAL